MPTWTYHYAGLVAGFIAIFILDVGFAGAFLLYFVVTIQLLIARMLYAEKAKKEEE